MAELSRGSVLATARVVQGGAWSQHRDWVETCGEGPLLNLQMMLYSCTGPQTIISHHLFAPVSDCRLWTPQKLTGNGRHTYSHDTWSLTLA